MPRKKRRSRLASKERDRILRRSALMLLGTFIITGIGLIWGIPLIIRIAGIFGDIRNANQPIAVSDTTPPLPPRISSAYEATNSAQIDLTGIGESNAMIVLLKNNVQVGETYVDESGSFVFENIDLNPGTNRFEAKAYDQAQNESGLSNSLLVVNDTQVPEIQISTPENGQSFSGLQSAVITVTGEVSEEADLYINDRFVILSGDNTFSHRLNLEEGENQIEVTAIDQAGNSNQESISVNYYP